MTRALANSRRIHHRKGAMAAIVAAFQLFARRRRDRHSLAQLDPHLLRDIGLNADRVSEECAKPFWQA